MTDASRPPAGTDAGRRVSAAGWKDTFFAALGETSHVGRSCEQAGVERGRVYGLRRRDPAFRERWVIALIEGYDHLEMELLHHLRMGDQPGGAKFNPMAALRMLQQRGEKVAQEKARRANVDVATIRASIDRKIAEMRAMVRAENAAADEDDAGGDDGA